MDAIRKLLERVVTKDRERLLRVLEMLLAGDTNGMNVRKVAGTDFFRVRSGRFRIIFHKEKPSGEIVVDSIRLRNEQTYRNV